MTASKPTIYADGTYLANNPDWHEADAPFKAEWIAGLLQANHVCPARIIDVGCGVGGVLAGLASRFPGARCDGYDISPDAFAIAKRRESGNLTFHLGTPTTSATADVALAIDVFEHVEDYISFLRGMRGIATLKVFHIPLDLNVQGMPRPSALAHSRNAIGHLHYFTRETALATLADCGYQVVDWRYTHGALTLPGRQVRTRFLNVVRRLLQLVAPDLSVRVLGGASLLVLAR